MNSYSNYYYQDLDKFFRDSVPSGNTWVKLSGQPVSGKFDYLLLPNTFAYASDVQAYIASLRKHCHDKTRIVVTYYNFLWKPILDAATYLGLRKRDIREPNWLLPTDILNLFLLENFDQIQKGRRFLLPVSLGFFSKIINQYIAPLPIINNLCLTTYQVFRLKPLVWEYSTSIVIPARNEAGHIKGVLSRIPKLGKKTEIIFVEGNSTDNTADAIEEEIRRYKARDFELHFYKQRGKGKGDAVRLGFKKAKNNILMILDADLTVPPSQLVKFYRAIAEGHCEFANGSRLVYPMEKQAMRTLNYLGNKMFSLVFTFLLDQPIRDTLCGTKALFRDDYLRISRNRKVFGDFDPFGDFDLLFGAAKLHLKIMEIPISYKERTYGKTNISRFTHGWLLLKMTLLAAKKIKFI